ncbi:hypothetical protein HYFRA_00013360 [Hymenoscyphus fraxineus]|uniref:Uncharacterized protein n=1 Tax=Hymenoscyphus fraxineus TaxID=746836 RepID=A0A9N9LC14_9HELO|nr:hypothetical protein HYFRA_00013360 [Hymenoscyphus fraxineus]
MYIIFFSHASLRFLPDFWGLAGLDGGIIPGSAPVKSGHRDSDRVIDSENSRKLVGKVNKRMLLRNSVIRHPPLGYQYLLPIGRFRPHFDSHVVKGAASTELAPQVHYTVYTSLCKSRATETSDCSEMQYPSPGMLYTAKRGSVLPA